MVGGLGRRRGRTRPTRTIAIESEDAAAVVAAVARSVSAVRQHELAAWLAALARIGAGAVRGRSTSGTNSVKFHVGERDGGGAWRTIVDRAEVTRLGEGLDERGAHRRRSRSSGPSTRSRPWSTRRRRHGVRAIVAVGTAGLRIARNSATVVDGDPGADGRLDRGDLGRGGGPARLPRGEARGSASPTDRWSCSTPAAAARSSPSARRARRRAVQRERRRRALHRTVRARRRGHERRAARALDGDRRRSRRGSTDGRRLTRWSAMGGAVTNIAAVKLGLATYDPDVVQGTRPRPRRDRPADRAVPVARRRRAPRDRRPAAQACRGHPRRRVHRANGDGASSARTR